MESLAPNCGVTLELGHSDLFHSFYGPKFILTYCNYVEKTTGQASCNMLAASHPAVGIHGCMCVCVCVRYLLNVHGRWAGSAWQEHKPGWDINMKIRVWLPNRTEE